MASCFPAGRYIWDMDLPTPTSIVVVGGGLAAVRASESLRDQGYDGRLSVVCDEPDAPYDRPPLSKDLLLGETDATPTLLGQERCAELSIDLRSNDAAVRLDLGGGRVELASGAHLEADRVLLATGGRARSLPVPGSGLDGVVSLRTVADARRIRSTLQANEPVVVVGGGFIGMEVAAAARTRGCAVTVLEAADHPLGRVLPAQTARYYAVRHRERGVHLMLGTTVAAIEGRRHVEGVLLDSGERIEASCVIVGIGIEPAVDLASEAGLAVADGILADRHLRTSNPHVYTAGDVAYADNPWLGGHGRLEQWQNAQYQGTAAAASMLGLPVPPPPVPWFWSDQFDLRLQVAGVVVPGREVVERGSLDEDNHCAFHLEDGRLTAAVGINRPRDVRGAMVLMESGVRVTAEALADPGQDLRRLARMTPR